VVKFDQVPTSIVGGVAFTRYIPIKTNVITIINIGNNRFYFCVGAVLVYLSPFRYLIPFRELISDVTSRIVAIFPFPVFNQRCTVAKIFDPLTAPCIFCYLYILVCAMQDVIAMLILP
jgi:hypothetical protein